MSDDRHDNGTPDRDTTRALAALAHLPRAASSATARAHARAAFVDGTRIRRYPVQRRPLRRWAAVLVAAAIGTLAIAWFGAQPEIEWRVLDVIDPSGVSAASSVVPGARLAAGPLATGLESELEVQLGDRLRFRMMPGTLLDLPKPPGRWFGRDRDLSLVSGEIYGTTGGRELGFGLSLSTDELEALLTGTTFAVFRTDSASCVCLWNGGITVTPLVGPDTPVILEELRRVWVYKDGRPPEILPLSGMETMKLQMMRDGGLAPPAAD